MSKEFKAPRDLPTIQREYSNLCTRAGDIQYKVSALSGDLAVLNAQLKDLNFEAVASAEAASKAEAAAKAEAEKKAAEAAKDEPTNVTPISQEQANG